MIHFIIDSTAPFRCMIDQPNLLNCCIYIYIFFTMLKAFSSLSNFGKAFFFLNNYSKLSNTYYFSNTNDSNKNRS